MERKSQLAPPYRKRTLRVEGHRGAGFLSNENTLPAFKKGADLDLDGVELDVFVTRDEFPIVVHGTDDYLIEFVDSSKNGYPRDMDYKEIENLEVKTGGTIPLLADVLNICKGNTWINIEFKEPDRRVVEPTVKVLYETGMLSQIVYSSFIHSLRDELELAYKKLGIDYPFSFGYLVWQFEEFSELSGASERDSLNIDYELYQKDPDRILKEIQKANDMNMKIKFYMPRPYKETFEDVLILQNLGVDTLITDYPMEALDLVAKLQNE